MSNTPARLPIRWMGNFALPLVTASWGGRGIG
jgi:hypothetical protein